MKLHGKLVLVTGVTGFVGRCTAQRLVSEGISVRGLARRLVDLPDVTHFVGDITDAETELPAATGADVVIHCAGVMHGATREEAMQVNVDGTRIILDAALRSGCERCIYISTVSAQSVEGYDVVDESTPLPVS